MKKGIRIIILIIFKNVLIRSPSSLKSSTRRISLSRCGGVRSITLRTVLMRTVRASLWNTMITLATGKLCGYISSPHLGETRFVTMGSCSRTNMRSLSLNAVESLSDVLHSPLRSGVGNQPINGHLIAFEAVEPVFFHCKIL